MATPASSEWLSRTGRVTRAGPELWILSMTDAIIGLDGAVRTTRRFMSGGGARKPSSVFIGKMERREHPYTKKLCMPAGSRSGMRHRA